MNKEWAVFDQNGKFVGLRVYLTEEEGRAYLEWLNTEHRDDIKRLADEEAVTKTSNQFTLKWERETRDAVYTLKCREVGPWKPT